MGATVTRSKIIENSATVLLARVLGVDGNPIVPSGVSSITFRVFNNSDGTQTGTGTLDPATTILATPVMNAVLWPYDSSTPYNFYTVLDGSNWPEGGVTYQCEIKISPVSGATHYVLFQLTTLNIFSE